MTTLANLFFNQEVPVVHADTLTRTDKKILSRVQTFSKGDEVTLRVDLRGVVAGIPAPGAVVEVVRSDNLKTLVKYHSLYGEKFFHLPTEFFQAE